MKALLLTEYKKLELTDFPVPEIGPEELLIQVKACGICGSDVHGFDGSTGRRIPPIVMGHEASGVVVKTGADVTKFQAGDRVTFDSMVSCGKCHFCRHGQINLCDNRQVMGVSCQEFKRHGAFAEYVAVPQHIVFRLPDAVSFEQAAMIEPVSVAVHAVNLTPIELGATGVVVGSGMVGLLVVQALRAAGCARVIAVDIADGKLETAKALGADVGLNPKSCDVPAEIRKLTEGRGADAAIEVVGAADPIKTAIASVRKGGTVTLVGNLAPTVELPLQQVVTRQIKLIGSCASSGEYPECMALMASGAIKVDPLISARAPLDEGVRWFERLYGGEPNLMKVILRP